MTSPEHESFLPRVEPPDLLELVFDDITDPSHDQRWADFYRGNRTLAREILKRISVRAQFDEASLEERAQLNRAVTEAVSYVTAALEAAAKRQREVQSTADDGADDEARPL